MSERSTVTTIVNFIVDSPKSPILAGLFLIVAVSYGTSKLYTDFSYRICVREDNPKLAQFDEFERKFGSDELAVVVVDSPSGVFDLESMNLMVSEEVVM